MLNTRTRTAEEENRGEGLEAEAVPRRRKLIDAAAARIPSSAAASLMASILLQFTGCCSLKPADLVVESLARALAREVKKTTRR
jgi:hypothetical protein